MITCFRAPSLGQQLKELPTRLRVAPWGRTESVKCPVVVNETTVKALPRLQELTNFKRIDFDFNHNTVPGSEEFKAHPPPRKIAGKGTPEVVPGEGIFLNAIEWTPEGQEAVKNGHYGELSMAAKFSEKGEVIWLHSVGLVPHGAIEGLTVFSAEEPACLAGAIQTFSAESGVSVSSQMNHKALLCILLGLTESATDEQITAGVATFSASIKGLATFSTDLATLRKRLDDQERGVIKADALRAGKLIPLTADELPIEQFRKLVAELPADQVPMDKRTPEGIKTFSSSGLQDAAAGAGADEVRSALGISEDSWKKHAK